MLFSFIYNLCGFVTDVLEDLEKDDDEEYEVEPDDEEAPADKEE